MKEDRRLRRWLMFSVGVVFTALGIGIMTIAGVGTSPISSVPNVLSLIFPPSIGVFSFSFNMLLILFQAILLGRRFPKIWLLQIPFTLVFSAIIDLTVSLLRPAAPQSYPFQLLVLLLGITVLALVVTLQVFANVLMLPGEATVQAVSLRFGLRFGNAKVATDAVLTAIAAAISLAAFRGLNGVREGTILAAILTGQVVKLYTRLLDAPLRHILGQPPAEEGPRPAD